MESALRQGGRDPSLKLIETLGWDGTQAVRAARHLARLARSAALLGWACDLAAAEAALRQDLFAYAIAADPVLRAGSM